jgi:uncharacterized protein YndB with AHSA1/START domain
VPDILHLVRIQASPERVYDALTTPEGIRNWWTRDSDLDVRVGGEGEFRFYGGKTITQIRIDELRPHARVSWTVTASGAPGGWAGTTIAFELRPTGDVTVLAFRHRGFAEANDGYALVNTGWAYYLVSLQQYLELGRGAPHPDIEFGRMIGHGTAAA